MKIGNLKIMKGAFLAPMADYTNIAFRTLCKEYGAALVYTELISAKAINLRNKKTKKMLKTSQEEKPVFLQLFGNDPIEIGAAVEYVEKEFPDSFEGYDLNCGCAVPKALKGNYGCYLMDYPLLIGELVSAMKSKTKKPVTLKIRLGLKKETYLEVGKIAEKAGADAICLHSRLGTQHYSGKADWKAIKKLKKILKIPIIGNGDIESKKDFKKMIKETNCDFVMVGRNAIGNAFIFKQIITGKERTFKERIKEAKHYIELAEKFDLGVNDIRGYFIGMPRGLKGASEIRNEFARAKTINEIKQILEKLETIAMDNS
jgi:tRNA-dihydrouridine synthase B